MPRKKATATRAKAKPATTARTRRKKVEEEIPLFPKTLIVEWSDGHCEEMPFANPKESASGNLNAWAGNKFVRDGEMLRVNCNVTKVRG